VPLDLPQAAVLLFAPLSRHLVEERAVHASVELVDVHGVDAVAEPVFALEPPDCFLVLTPFIGVAGVQRLVYPARSRRARHRSIPARGGFRALAGRTLATPIRRPLGAPLDKHPHVGFRHFPESTAFPSGQNFDREDPLGFPEGRLAGARWAEG